MKRIITILIIFCAFQSEAQTYTTAKLSQYMRAQWATNDSVRSKQAIKDVRDDERNVKIDSLFQRVSLLFWQTEKLDQRTTRVENRVDSAGAYLSDQYYNYDPVAKVYTPKPDTLIVYRPKVDKSSLQLRSGFGSETLPYTLTSKNKTQDEDNLRWQIDQFEKLLDDREKVIDKLQKKIKAQQKVIDKLKH